MLRSSLIVVALMCGAPAWAQPANLTPEQKTKAEEFFRAGERAFNAKDYLVAAQALEEALKLYPVLDIIFSTAQAYRLQYFVDKDPGWLKRSIELYRRYVNEAPKNAKRRGDAVESLSELEPIMSRIEAASRGPIETKRMAEVTQLMVSTNVDKARTTIDGQPASLKVVDEGWHVVRAEADGYYPVEEKRQAVAGRLVVAELMLKPMPATVHVRTQGGAHVSVDGRAHPEAPGQAVELAAGKHFITVTHRGRYPWMREITVKRGQQLDVAAPLHTTTQRKIAWGVLGASVVVFGAATFTGIQALSANSNAVDLRDKLNSQGLTVDELAQYEYYKQRRSDKLDQTLVFAGVGTAVAATGVLMMLFDNPSAEAPMSAPMTAGMRAGITPGGLVVSGRF
ncbi:MAG TPA: PEGA domain-containing protein [Kofleriaceae bacterium]|jgi:hypothetical protein|nr:PEGA domain-containing protein [Kofleriaceae bacterium]